MDTFKTLRTLALEACAFIHGGSRAPLEKIVGDVLAQTAQLESAPVFDSGDCVTDVRNALAANRKIPAIKALRTGFNLGLREAKAIVEILSGETVTAVETLGGRASEHTPINRCRY